MESGAQLQSYGLTFVSLLRGVRLKHVDTEVSIMRKLMHHKNVLQLLDWNAASGWTRFSVPLQTTVP